MQGARDHPVLLALAALAQVDQGHVGLPGDRHGLLGRDRPAAPGDLVLGQALAQVGGNGHVHHLGVGQVELAHQLDVLVDRLHLQAGVVALLLADGGDRVALVVVGGIDQRLLGQLQQLAEQGLVLRPGAAVLEVGAAGAADQQRVAGEHAVAHQEAVGIVGVAGRVQHIQGDALDGQLVALGDAHGHHVDLGHVAHDGDAMRAVAQRAEPGDVVGMDVRIHGLDQLEVQLVDELQIAVDLLQHGIDDDRLAAAAAGHQVAVGAGDAVEQLTENHVPLHGKHVQQILPRALERGRISYIAPAGRS